MTIAGALPTAKTLHETPRIANVVTPGGMEEIHMSVLNPGTRCVIVGGCKENIGLVVEVIQRLGTSGRRQDAYYVRTISGRPFHQLWHGNDLHRGNSGVTDRHKLRPLVDPKDDVDSIVRELDLEKTT